MVYKSLKAVLFKQSAVQELFGNIYQNMNLTMRNNNPRVTIKSQ